MKSRQVDDYEILGSIARGGMATVCLAKPARRLQLPPVVCFKTLRPELQADPQFKLMLADEADIAMRLDHPNCIRTLATGPGYMVMEYVVGETLDLLLRLAIKRNTPLLPAAVAVIIASVCDALHYAHELGSGEESFGMIHRDVSPENIIISDRGLVKLLDFGVAKARDRRSVTASGIVKGKFSYMSPEQMSAQPIDRRSDVYGLGVTLYSCLTNRRPYEKMDLEELFDAKAHGTLPPAVSVVPTLDPRLSKIADKAMARRPPDRFATAAEMGAALRACVPPEASEHLATMLLTSLLRNVVAKKRAAFERLLAGEVGPEVLQGLRVVPIDPSELFPRDTVAAPASPFDPPTDLVPSQADATSLDPIEFDTDEQTEERPAESELDTADLAPLISASALSALPDDDDDEESVPEMALGPDDLLTRIDPTSVPTSVPPSDPISGPEEADFDDESDSTSLDVVTVPWTVDTGPDTNPPSPPPPVPIPAPAPPPPPPMFEEVVSHDALPPEDRIPSFREQPISLPPPPARRLPAFFLGLLVGAAFGFVMGLVAKDLLPIHLLPLP